MGDIENLKTKLTNTIAKKTVDLIINGLSSPHLNFQIENNVDASDILADILNNDYLDVLDVIQEQLIDIMLLGKCISGIVTRLLQIWLAIKK